MQNLKLALRSLTIIISTKKYNGRELKVNTIIGSIIYESVIIVELSINYNLKYIVLNLIITQYLYNFNKF